jgi:flagellar biogenesis protein FliO
MALFAAGTMFGVALMVLALVLFTVWLIDRGLK